MSGKTPYKKGPDRDKKEKPQIPSGRFGNRDYKGNWVEREKPKKEKAE
jgi:hypothetical protein